MEINLEAAWTKAKEEFEMVDPVVVANRTGATLLPRGRLRVSYFSRPVIVLHPSGEAIWEASGEALPLKEQILLLHYLCHAQGTPPERQWISFAQIPGGSIYVGPFRQRCIVPLVRRFGAALDSFKAAAVALGGEPVAFGDAAYALPAFPQAHLILVLWAGDEEFPANANILFDRSMVNYFTAEDCVVLAQLAVKYLAMAAGNP